MPVKELRFLVVEDHEFQLKMQVRLLSQLGAKTIHTAGNGKVALEILRDPARPVDIVICDLAMPLMDGVEFMRNLHGLGGKISVIVSSGLKPGLVRELVGLMDTQSVNLLGWVEKPLTADKLLSLVESPKI